MPLKLTKTAPGRWTATGAFDELADYGPLTADTSPVLALDLRGIHSITSHGLRNWVMFMMGFQGKAIEFYACPPVFLDAVDIIPKVLPAPAGLKSIKSCWTEYFCDHCEKQFAIEVARQEFKHANFELLCKTECPRCLNEMRADGNVEIYCDLLDAT